MKTLAIETSCDDTSVAIVSYENNHFSLENMVTHSQTILHNEHGGVVPELAYRAHAEHIVAVIEELGGPSLQEEIDNITVTARPGLPGALLVGISTAHTLGALWNKPVLEVNHIMGHVFSVLLGRSLDISQVPYVCLTVSGGHTDIYVVHDKKHPLPMPHAVDETNWIKRQHLGIGEEIEVGPFLVTKLGQTRDDAAGEAFDKVARMLDGPYPGGAWLSKLAQQGGPDDRITLRPTYLEKESYDMSFSGLKSQVVYLLDTWAKEGIVCDEQAKANIARAFQEAITSVMAKKVAQAAVQYEAQVVGLVGGVAANTRLQEQVVDYIAKRCQNPIPVVQPTQMVYCTDNAAMIGAVGLLMSV